MTFRELNPQYMLPTYDLYHILNRFYSYSYAVVRILLELNSMCIQILIPCGKSGRKIHKFNKLIWNELISSQEKSYYTNFIDLWNWTKMRKHFDDFMRIFCRLFYSLYRITLLRLFQTASPTNDCRMKFCISFWFWFFIWLFKVSPESNLIVFLVKAFHMFC